MRKPATARGFTLIELIAVIVLISLLAGLAVYNVSEPLAGYVDATRRAALSDRAGLALARIGREVRLALPNSVRIAGGDSLEFLRTRSGGRYRAAVAADGSGDALDFGAVTDSFDVLGELKDFGGICTAASGNCSAAGAAGTASCMSDPGIDCLVIFNTGQPSDCGTLPGARTNAYCGDNVAGIEAVDGGTRTLRFVHDLPGGFAFTSPRQRFHVVDTPVSFICDTATRSLRRYEGYPIAATQPDRSAPPAATGNLLAEDVVACAFTYDPGSATRAALLTLRLTLADAAAPDEQVTLFTQVHVPNVP